MAEDIVRVLRIPNDGDADEEGRRFGDDFQLAFIGNDGDAEYYVTTDGIHASELGGFPIFEPGNLSRFIVEKINGAWREHREERAP